MKSKFSPDCTVVRDLLMGILTPPGRKSVSFLTREEDPQPEGEPECSGDNEAEGWRVDPRALRGLVLRMASRACILAGRCVSVNWLCTVGHRT